MYLVDTDVLSELRRRDKADSGVVAFIREAAAHAHSVNLSAITIGELRRGAELMRHRGDSRQASQLDRWIENLLAEYDERILPVDTDVAQIWGRLRVPHPENSIDKQIAATALIYDLVLVTGNVRHFARTGVRLLDPYTRAGTRH